MSKNRVFQKIRACTTSSITYNTTDNLSFCIRVNFKKYKFIIGSVVVYGRGWNFAYSN